MSRIRVLPPHVADQIAAGEVVERPASVVKELMENAVDAGAKGITVEIRRGGVSFIRVTDDGSGMGREDAHSAFLRHATSKITRQEDLAAIRTLGFRGEALAAICAVSRVELLTCEQGAALGTALSLEAGEIVDEREAGCPAGTTILVRDLFFNTPARHRFLKKDAAEGASVLSCVQRAAMSRPDIAFTFIRDGRADVRTPGDGDLKACLYALYGREVAQGLLPVSWDLEDIKVSGYVGKPGVLTRANRQWQYFFVNGRPVSSRMLSVAAEEAVRHAVTTGRYPVCMLYLELPPGRVDVNVHPAKSEVKFDRDRMVFDAVYAAVKAALEADGETVTWQAPEGKTETSVARLFSTPTAPAAPAPAPLPWEATRADDEEAYRQAWVAGTATLGGWEASQAEITVREALPYRQEEGWHFVGEVLGGYLIVEQADHLLLIDKHAAHERAIFNRLSAGGLSQVLITPCVASLSPEEHAVLTEHREFLEQTGFDLEDFGNGSLAVRAAPDGLAPEELSETLSELAGKLLEGKKEPLETRREKLLESIACKAAVKLGKRLDAREAHELVRMVISDPAIKTCPHGRPVAVMLTRKQLEKQFFRI